MVQVDTASEVEELDIDVSPAPYPASRGAAKLQVFISRYRYGSRQYSSTLILYSVMLAL